MSADDTFYTASGSSPPCVICAYVSEHGDWLRGAFHASHTMIVDNLGVAWIGGFFGNLGSGSSDQVRSEP